MPIVDPDLSDVGQPPVPEEAPPSPLKDPDLQDLHPPAPEPDKGFWHEPKRVMSKINEGIAKGIAFPSEMVRAALQGLDYGLDYAADETGLPRGRQLHELAPTGQDIKHFMQDNPLGLNTIPVDEPAKTPVGKVLDRSLELGGEAATLGGPLRSGLRYLSERVVNPVAAAVLKEIGGSGTLGSELKNLGLDFGLGSISGGGGEVAAQNAGEEYRKTGELAAGLSPLLLLGPMAAARSVLPPIGREAQERAALELVNPELADIRSSARKMLGHRIKEAEREAADVPGYQPTTGALLDDPNLLGRERALAVSDEDAKAELLRLRRQNQTAMTEGLDEVAPAGDPQAPRRAASARVQAFRDKVKARRERLAADAQLQAEASKTKATDQLDEAKAAFLEADSKLNGPHADVIQEPEAASRTLAEQLTAAEKTANKRAEELFGEVDKTAEVSLYPLRKARDEVQAMAKERGREDAIPGILKKPKDDDGKQYGKYLDDYLNPPADSPDPKKFLPKLPVSQLQGLRSRLTTARRQLREAGGDEQEQSFLGMLIKGVDDTLEQAAEEKVSGPYKRARDYFRENVAGPFRDNTISKIIRGDVAPAEAAGQVFKPGERGAAAADELTKAMGYGSEAYIRDYAIQKALTYAVGRDGRIDPAKLRAFNQKYAPALERFPAVRDELTNVQQMQQRAQEAAKAAGARVKEAEGQLAEAGKAGAQTIREAEERGAALGRRGDVAIQNQHAAMVLDSDPHKLITSIRNSKDPGETLTRVQQLTRKDPEAQAGLARAYWDNLMSRITSNTEGDPIRAAALSRLLKDPKEVALQQQLLTPGQRFRLGNILKAAQTEQRAAAAKVNRAGSDTAENTAGGRLLEHGMRAVLGGPIGSGVATVLQAMKLAPTRDNILALYREAMLDPKAMEGLLARVDKQGIPDKRSYQQLLNLQARLRPDPYQDPDKEK